MKCDNLPASVQKYRDELKDYYAQRLSVVPDEPDVWPPPVANYDTQLALIEHEDVNKQTAQLLLFGSVDGVVARKKEIKYHELFDMPSTSKLTLLIDGAPGVGKTTLCRRIAKDWALGKMLQNYVLVLLVPLREIVDASKVDDLFLHDFDDEKVFREVISYVKEKKGQDVLLILDGFDELSLEKRKKSIFIDIIWGKRLKDCGIVVSSRPYASQSLQNRKYISRHVEIIGFSKSEIQKCISSAFPNEEHRASTLMKELQGREDLLSLCYVPINCSIVIAVYKGENYRLPSTVTEMYKMFLTNTLRSHARKYNLPDDFEDLTSLPDDMKNPLDTLSEVAFKHLCKDEFTFKRDDLGGNSASDMHLKIMGLVTCFQCSSGYKLRSERFQFLHLTIQEFLAAWHASQFDTEKQSEIINDTTNTRLKVLRCFLAGLTELTDMQVRKAFVDSVKWGPVVEVGLLSPIMDSLHMIYEAQNKDLCRMVKQKYPKGELYFQSLYPVPDPVFRYKIISFFLSYSSSPWELVSFGQCNMNDACIRTFRIEEKPTSSINKIILSSATNLSSRCPTLDSLSLIPRLPILKSVHSLEICCVNVSSTGKSGLADVLEMKELKSLSFSLFDAQNPMALKTATKISMILEKKPSLSNSLEELNLSLDLTVVDDKAIEFLGRALAHSDVKKLKVLFQYSTGTIGFENLLSHVVEMKNLQFLDVELQHVPQKVTSDYQVIRIIASHPSDRFKHLETLLVSSQSLTDLRISNLEMSNSDVNFLCRGLKQNTTLRSLSLHPVNLDLRLQNQNSQVDELFQSLLYKKFQALSFIFTGSSGEEVVTWNTLSKIIIQNPELEEIELQNIPVEAMHFISHDSISPAHHVLHTLKLTWSGLFCVTDAICLFNTLKNFCKNLACLTLHGLVAFDHDIKAPSLSDGRYSSKNLTTLGSLLGYFLWNNDKVKVIDIDLFPQMQTSNSTFCFSDSIQCREVILADKESHLLAELLNGTGRDNLSILHDGVVTTEFTSCQFSRYLIALYRLQIHQDTVKDLPNVTCLPLSCQSIQQIVSADKLQDKALKWLQTTGSLHRQVPLERCHNSDCSVFICTDIAFFENNTEQPSRKIRWVANVQNMPLHSLPIHLDIMIIDSFVRTHRKNLNMNSIDENI